jgi:hypothetical protein
MPRKKQAADEAVAETPVAETPAPVEKPQTPSSKIPKLQKKNKSRLPRREKKALKKQKAR